jgi:hypothetical protein
MAAVLVAGIVISAVTRSGMVVLLEVVVAAAGTGVVVDLAVVVVFDFAVIVFDIAVAAPAVMPLTVVVLHARRHSRAARVVGVLGLVARAGDVDADRRIVLAAIVAVAVPESAVGRAVVVGCRGCLGRPGGGGRGLNRPDRRVVARVDRGVHHRGEQAHQENRHCECHQLAHDPSIGTAHPAAGQPGVRAW